MSFTKWYDYSFDFKTNRSKREILSIIENEFKPISEKIERKKEEEEEKVLCEYIDRENLMSKVRHDILNINIESDEDTISEYERSEDTQKEYTFKANLECAPSSKFFLTVLLFFFSSPFVVHISPILFLAAIISPIIFGVIYIFQRVKIKKKIEKKMADIIAKIANKNYEVETEKTKKQKNVESDKYESLERISELKEQEILSDEEFEKEKEKILGKNN